MRIRSIITGGTIILAGLMFASIGQAQDLYRGRSQNDSRPNSLLARKGNLHLEPAQSAINPIGAQVLVAQTDQPVYGAPAGNILLRSRTDPNGDDTIFDLNAGNGYLSEVFNQEFTTALGSTYLDIAYSTQAWIATGPDYDGIGLECMVYQGTPGNWGTGVPASGTIWQPYLIRQNSVGAGLMIMTGYHGFITIAPGMLTKVVLSVKTTKTHALVAANNLIIRY